MRQKSIHLMMRRLWTRATAPAAAATTKVGVLVAQEPRPSTKLLASRFCNVVGRGQTFFSTNSLTEEASGNGRMCSLLLDETAEQFKESVRQFAQENIAPHAAKVDASNSFPKDVNLWKLMGDFNLHGITVPEEFGGLGLGYLYHCIAMEEISRASGSVALSYGAHSNLCINQLVKLSHLSSFTSFLCIKFHLKLSFSRKR
jgi:hypothetical protein